MIASHDTGYTAKDVEVLEIYQCWKDGTDYTAGLTGVRCHLFEARATDTKKVTLYYRLYKLKTATKALDPSTNLPGKDNAYMFWVGTKADGSNPGFQSTTIFTELYVCKVDEATASNAKAAETVKESALVAGGTKKFSDTGINLKAKPTINREPAGTGSP